MLKSLNRTSCCRKFVFLHLYGYLQFTSIFSDLQVLVLPPAPRLLSRATAIPTITSRQCVGTTRSYLHGEWSKHIAWCAMTLNGPWRLSDALPMKGTSCALSNQHSILVIGQLFGAQKFRTDMICQNATSVCCLRAFDAKDRRCPPL